MDIKEKMETAIKTIKEDIINSTVIEPIEISDTPLYAIKSKITGNLTRVYPIKTGEWRLTVFENYNDAKWFLLLHVPDIHIKYFEIVQILTTPCIENF